MALRLQQAISAHDLGGAGRQTIVKYQQVIAITDRISSKSRLLRPYFFTRSAAHLAIKDTVAQGLRRFDFILRIARDMHAQAAGADFAPFRTRTARHFLNLLVRFSWLSQKT